ncbi:MAG: hypothetical protein HZA46_20685, partial [Planctomycetales bacterium]|nr:hypothetical protein [Planctomycetales bacterium]
PSPQRGEGVVSRKGWPERLQTWVVLAAIAAVSLFNLAFFTTPLCNFNVFLLDLNQARSMAARITAPEIAYLNEHLPPGSKVLCVGEAQVFDAEFPLIYETVFDRSIFEEWCGDSDHNESPATKPLRDLAAIRRELQNHGVTHVLVNWSEILRYRTTYGYTDFVMPQRFTDLQRSGVLGQAWEIPFAFREVPPLSAETKSEVERLGAALGTQVGGQSAFPAFQVFPVEK